jgi:hypothetical protein
VINLDPAWDPIADLRRPVRAGRRHAEDPDLRGGSSRELGCVPFLSREGIN